MISIVGFDTETTGLQQEKHKIIELCAQRFDYDHVSKAHIDRGCRVWRFNPMRNIDKSAQAVHKISLNELRQSPLFADRVEDIDEMFDVDVIVGHNAVGFDIPFMEKEYRNQSVVRGGFLKQQRVVDTALESNWATAYGKMPKLEELCFACGVEYDREEAHAAEYDVRVMMDCFFVGVEKGLYVID